MGNLDKIVQVISDQYLFPILQGILIFVLVMSLLMEFISQMRAGFGGTKLTVTRSQTSMNIYYGMYAAISGVLVALCLSVEYAKDHRTFWVAVDIFASSYLCLFNPWFRIKLQNLSTYLTKVEAR